MLHCRFNADTYRRIDLGAVETHKTLDFDFQHHLTLGRHDVVWGAGYRATNSGVASSNLYFVPINQTDGLYSTFVQDEININDRWWLTIGSKFEHNAYTGFEFEPGASLAWTPTRRQTLWISAARAIRQPSRYENAIDATLSTVPLPQGLTATLVMLGNPNFQAEELRDYEAGYRAQLGGTSRWTSRCLEPLPAPCDRRAGRPVSGAQPLGARTIVATDVSQQRARQRLRRRALGHLERESPLANQPGYSWIEMKPELDPGSLTPFGNLSDGDAPKHMFQIRSLFNLSKKVEFDNTVYYVAHLAVNNVPGNVRLDTRIGWRSGEGVEFSIVGQNLLRPQTLEFGEAAAVVGTETQRSIFGKITWRF